jgi:hypothetical protein
MTRKQALKRIVPLALVLLAVVLGLVLKAERYAGRFADHSAEDRQRISVFVASSGWTLAPPANPDWPFTSLTFTKPGCERQLVVAPMGSTLELQHELRLALGSDLAFVAGTSGRFGVAPAPKSGTGPCAVPPPEAWEAL